jgi:hypothetical protein
MMASNEFKAPMYRLIYRNRLEQAYIQGYNLEGKPFTSPPRKFDVANLPLLVFQLVDAGYIVHRADDGLITAVSNTFFLKHKREVS